MLLAFEYRYVTRHICKDSLFLHITITLFTERFISLIELIEAIELIELIEPIKLTELTYALNFRRIRLSMVCYCFSSKLMITIAIKI